MAHLSPATGLMEDDADGPAPPQGGSLGAQAAAPVAPPPIQGPPLPSAIAPVQGPPAPPIEAPPPPVAIPDKLSAIPPVTPYQAQPPVAVPPSRVVSPAESQTLGQIDQNTAARGITAQQGGQLDTKKAEAQAEQAERNRLEAEAHQAERQKLAEESAARVKEAEARQQQQYDAYRQMGIKDPEAEQSFGHRLLAAIAIGIGEYAAVKGGGTNRAAQLISAANAQNIALQKAAIEKQFQAAQLAGGDVIQARTDRDEAMKGLDQKHAALLDSSAAKLKSELGRIGVPEQQIAANGEVQKIENEALQLREKNLTSIRGDQERLDAAEIAAAARKKKGGAGTGGSPDAMTAFTDAAGQLKPGEQIPASVVALGIKAGLKRDKIASQVDAYRNTGTKSDILGGKDDAAVNAFVRTRLKDDKELAGDLKERQEVNKALALAKPGPDGNVSGVNFQQAIDATVKAATGLGARPGSIAVFQGSLGGVWDKVERFIQHGETGQYTAHDVQVLNDALKKQRNYVNGNIKEKQETYRTEFSQHPTTKGHQQAYEAELGGHFGPDPGAADRAARAAAIVNDPSKRSLYSDAQWAALIRASRSP